MSDSDHLEKQLEDVSLARRDLEDSSKYIKTMEKQMRSLTQEKDDLHRVKPWLYGVYAGLWIKVLHNENVMVICIHILSLFWPGSPGGLREDEVSDKGAEGSPQPEKSGHAGVFWAQWETHRPQVTSLTYPLALFRSYEQIREHDTETKCGNYIECITYLFVCHHFHGFHNVWILTTFH